MNYRKAVGIGVALGVVEWVLVSSTVPWLYSVVTIGTGVLVGFFAKRRPLTAAMISGSVAAAVFDTLFLLMVQRGRIEFSPHLSAASFFAIANVANVLVVLGAAAVASGAHRTPRDLAA